VAVSGDTVVVGAQGEDSGTTWINSTPDESVIEAGAAYVFARSGTTWSQQAYLKAGQVTDYDYFGTSVAVSGDTVVVGAQGEDSSMTGIDSTPDEGAFGAGAAYIFVRIGSTWSQQAYLKASQVNANDQFGISVAVSGDTVVVGAQGEDSGTTWINSTPDESVIEAGAAYVFVRSGSTWSQQTYLKAGQVTTNDNFGGSVSVDGDTVVVGASGEDSSTTGVNSVPDERGANTGAAYIFTDMTVALAVPIVVNPTVASIKATEALLGGNVITDGGATVTERGVVYSATTTNSYPLINGTGVVKVAGTANLGLFTVAVGNLAPSTHYSYKAYVTNSEGTSYTSVGTFSTLSTNADLSALTLSSGTLSSAFASGTIAYTTSVANAVSSIIVTPTGAQANATIEARVNGGSYTNVSSGSASAALTLNVDGNTMEVRVTAQDGVTQKTYTVTVNRLRSYLWAGFAGTAEVVGSTDATGAAAAFAYPGGVALDSAGNAYVADTSNHTIRKITPAGVVTTLAGLAGTPGTSDGSGAAARFNTPGGVAVDASGNVYVADTSNHTIRRITSAGLVTTFAGSGGTSGSADGPGNGARFLYPNALAVDSSGNVYVADTNNHTVRKITPTRVVSTLAGTTGSSGSTDATGATARFNYPMGIAVGAGGVLVVADQFNHTLRRVTGAGVVSTLAGAVGVAGSANGPALQARFNYPAGVAVDAAGRVYVADSLNHTIRRMEPDGTVLTIGGLAETAGSIEGADDAARFSGPMALAVDAAGRLYVADQNNSRISRGTPAAYPPSAALTSISELTSTTVTLGGSVTPNGLTTTAVFDYGLTTAYGSTMAASPGSLQGTSVQDVSVSLSGLLTGSTYYYRLRVTNVDGTQNSAGGTFTTLLNPSYATGTEVPVTANGYTATGSLQVLLGYSPTPGQVLMLVNNTSASPVSGTFSGLAETATITSTYGGNTFAFRISYVGGDGNDITLTRFGNSQQIGNSSNVYDWSLIAGNHGEAGIANGSGTNARFFGPVAIAIDSVGNLFVVDSDNHTIRKITPAGIVSTFAGSPGVRGSADGLGSVARFDGPFGISCDSNDNLYIADQGNSCVRKITPAGIVSTVTASVGQLAWGPQGVTVDLQGNLYISDTNQQRICKVTPQGVFSVLAGAAGQPGSNDGTGSAARFRTPSGIVADAGGNIYVADPGDHTIRKITPEGVVTTLAGSPGQAASVDGSGSVARLSYPTGITLDPSGDLFVCGADVTVRRITSSGVVTTVGGVAQQGGTANGVGSFARFTSAIGVAAGKFGELYVVQWAGSHVVRKGTPMGFKPLVALSSATAGLSVTVQGSVNPNGFMTSANLEYGKTSALGDIVPLSLELSAATTPQAVSTVLSSLDPGSTYYYRISASNIDGSVSTRQGTFTTLTLTQGWRQTHFGSPANTGNAADRADPDQDGLPNLLEYALNLPPNAASRATAAVQAASGSLEYTYTRGTAAYNGGTTFQVEWSDDLTTWFTTGVVESLISDDGTHQQIKATLPAGSAGRRFVRLRVQ
jgi:sugar lactone lactonase YvrE